mmetsp:Transcript_12554/g.15117  ORF Transcript_12554/g.15117 Transcript_12554/m.15117 type:complete len:210 (-) Transcript_12554:11195-11824(-)
MGVPGAESWKLFARSNGIDCTNWAPITFFTNSVTAFVNLSGRSARNNNSCWNTGSFFQSPGMGSASGLSNSIHSFHLFADPTMSSGKLLYASMSLRACTDAQHESEIQSGNGLSTPSTLGPLKRYENSTAFNSFFCFKIDIVSCVATIILSRSNSPAAMYENEINVVVSINNSTLFASSTTFPSFLSSGTFVSSGPPGVISIPFFRIYT